MVHYQRKCLKQRRHYSHSVVATCAVARNNWSVAEKVLRNAVRTCAAHGRAANAAAYATPMLCIPLYTYICTQKSTHTGTPSPVYYCPASGPAVSGPTRPFTTPGASRLAPVVPRRSSHGPLASRLLPAPRTASALAERPSSCCAASLCRHAAEDTVAVKGLVQRVPRLH